MTCEQFRDRMSDVLDGQLPDPEVKAWEAHRATCPTCAALWEAIGVVDAWLREAPPVLPPPDLSPRILRRVRWQARWERWGGFALFFMVGLGMAIAWAGPLESLWLWLGRLQRMAPLVHDVAWDLLRLPIARWAFFALMGLTIPLTAGMGILMGRIPRSAVSRRAP